MRKFDSKIDEPKTGWDAFGIELATKDGKELYVEGNEVWTQDKKEYIAELRKDGSTNMNKINNLDSINSSRIEGLNLNIQAATPTLIITMPDETISYELKNAFSIASCKDFLKSLNLVPTDQVIYNNFEQFKTQIYHISQLISIDRVLKLEESDALASDIFEIMLDGFTGQNLVTKANQEADLHKYVVMALNKFNELHRKGGE